MSIKTIFMGTPDFAVPGLQSLINNKEFNLIAVFTQPDKKVGRKQILQASPIKQLAQQYNISVFQPKKIKEEIETIKNLNPDLIVVIAYGQIIPSSILNIPKYHCINVHASLLPKYRGASCLNAPILNGDKTSGITIMRMDKNMDTGPIIHQEEIILNPNENLETLHDKLSQLGAKILPKVLLKYINKEIEEKEQDNDKASYVKLTKKEDGLIDWSKSALEIERQIRAYNPWPGTYTKYNNKTLKIIKANIILDQNHKIGEVFIHNNKLAIKTGQDALLILILQIESKQKMTSEEFINGHKEIIGKILQ